MKQELPEFDAAGNDQAKGAYLLPTVFRESQFCHGSQRDKKCNVCGCFHEFVIEPGRNSVGVEKAKDAGEFALNGFIYGARPECDQR